MQPRRVACPIASVDCDYGARLSARFDSFLIGLMSAVGVPARHLDNIAGSVNSVATHAAESWQIRGFLVLTGIPGVGKSFAAAKAVMKYLRSSIGNWFTRQEWENASQTAESVVWATAKEIVDDKFLAAKARAYRLAVLDDLGKEDETRVGMAVVRDVISKRYDAKLPTIITSELTLVNIQERYGRYIAERLVEDYCSKIVDCGGESLRLKESGAA
jgi:DNA replication protein DnaC